MTSADISVSSEDLFLVCQITAAMGAEIFYFQGFKYPRGGLDYNLA